MDNVSERLECTNRGSVTYCHFLETHYLLVDPTTTALLLKQHSGIVWSPGRFAVLLRDGDVRRLGNPAGAPALGHTPGNAWQGAVAGQHK